jgi:hypothetical protein
VYRGIGQLRDARGDHARSDTKRGPERRRSSRPGAVDRSPRREIDLGTPVYLGHVEANDVLDPVDDPFRPQVADDEASSWNGEQSIVTKRRPFTMIVRGSSATTTPCTSVTSPPLTCREVRTDVLLGGLDDGEPTLL